MRRKLLAILCTLALVCTANLVLPVTRAAAEETGRAYYISSLHGDNQNDGTSPDKAWQTLDKLTGIQFGPGDRILLEAGSIFQDGFIHLRDVSGTPEAPIEINKYGEGADPIIATNGQGIWYQDYGKSLDSSSHRYKGYVSSSILLYDAEYVEVSNIEMTNDDVFYNVDYSDLNKMNRTGVAVVAQNRGTVDHVYLKNLNVHDVDGNVYDKHMNNGGIYFTVFQPKNEAETGISRYDDVLIEGCEVNTVSRWGIAVGYTAYWNQFTTAEISDEVSETYGSTNVVIRNNYIKDAGGDAITTMYCHRPLIEYNVSDGAAREINPEIYSQTATGRVAAGIWPWKCKDAVFQYNEAFDTCQNQDGQAWDADWGDGTVYQYNYSHNNGGGSVMVCGAQAVNTIFRYNISQNDLSGVLNLPGNPVAYIYNNVFYMKEGVPFIRASMTGGVAEVSNNIIYNAGAEKSENWDNNCRMTYRNNLYYNYSNVPAGDAAAVTADPKFANAGSAPSSTTGSIDALSAFEGYQIADDSPAVNAGIYIPKNGGQDFFGNPVGLTPDIGVHETSVADLPVNGIFSDVYDISGDLISNVPKDTGVSEFLSNLKHSDGVVLKLTNGDAEVTQGAVENGMVLQVTNLDGSVSHYRIFVLADYTEYSPEGWTAEVGSYQAGNDTEGPGSFALDNNMNTIWHTDWNGCAQEDCWITIDMREPREISMLKYVPRPSGGANGIILEYEIYVSDDGRDFKKLTTIGNTWENDRSEKYAYFDTVTARYVKLVGTSTTTTVQGKIFCSAAEIRLGYES